MPRYNPRPRKGRARRQKVAVQIRTPTGQFSKPLGTKGCSEQELSTILNSSTALHSVKGGDTTPPIHVTLIQNDKRYDALRKRYKNALQREKRAKEKIQNTKSSADHAFEQLSFACHAKENAKTALRCAQDHTGQRTQDILDLQQRIHVLQSIIEDNAREVVKMSIGLTQQTQRTEKAEMRQKLMRRTHDSLRKQLKRKSTQANRLEEAPTQGAYPYHLKDQTGTIKPEVRDMLRKLACEGVSTERMSSVIDIVAEGMGIDVSGSISARSVARIMLEGLIQARMQLGHELSEAKSFSICGDGTSIKNQQHEAKLMYIHLPPNNDSNVASDAYVPLSTMQPVLRTLGVHKAVNHTAQQQLRGWIDVLDAYCSLLVRSPIGRNIHISANMVAPKLRGVLTDHAADQKRFHELLLQWKQKCDREVRAVSKLKKMAVEEQLNALSDHLDSAAVSISNWRDLPLDEQGALMHDAWLSLAIKLGESEFLCLTPEVQFEVDFLAWTGCCMHKELNAVKGGVAKMALEWKSVPSAQPIALYNKFVAENPQATEDKSSRGGIKLTSLAGALFRNKDDKKGYQKTVDNFFEKTFGYSNRFPDTSNTRYGSYCDAAAELLLHRETYLDLLEIIHDAKCTPGYTNIELNVSQGLKDTPTLTELAVLALYAQAVGRPYMRHVRSTTSNALDLGPLHDRVKRHCDAIARNPSLLMGLDVSAKTGTFDGQQWERPDVVYRVLSMAPTLPSLQPMLVSFFKGALETWERFTHEFNSDGVVARATPEQRQSAWVPPTNDVSEGALGQCRQMLRRAPTMSDDQRNARVMWQRNKTYDWGRQILTHQDERFIREEARQLDSSGSNKLSRHILNEALEERAAANRVRQSKTVARKSAREKRLDGIELHVDATLKVLSGMRVGELDGQIDKLRRVLGYDCMHPKTAFRNKSAKVAAVLSGLAQLKENLNDKKSAGLGLEYMENINMDMDTLFQLGDGLAEDAEMCFGDEVIF